jgi:hypothetical protein
MKNKSMETQQENEISSAYTKFFAKFKNHETLDISKWSLIDLLAYFCKRYEKHYGVKYTFRFNNNVPSKSYEMYRMKSLAQMITSDVAVLKDYIDWLFETEVVARKKRITALGFITNVELVNKYKFLKLIPNASIDRTTLLPANYLAIVKQYTAPINNYGDLAFVKDNEDYKEMMEKLVEAGFDMKILEKVK